MLRDHQRRREARKAFDRLNSQLLERRGRKRSHRNGGRLDIGGTGLRGGHRHSLGERGDLKNEIERRAAPASYIDLSVSSARTQ